jgi:hypothetical protein
MAGAASGTKSGALKNQNRLLIPPQLVSLVPI